MPDWVSQLALTAKLCKEVFCLAINFGKYIVRSCCLVCAAFVLCSVALIHISSHSFGLIAV